MSCWAKVKFWRGFHPVRSLFAEEKLALVTWQSVGFFDLDDPRNRIVFVQIIG
ncbi:YjbQ family protein [Microcoleus sp. FACHB-68]|nr:YjbQ family protein [Microcoleus sp. FACHB-68]